MEGVQQRNCKNQDQNEPQAPKFGEMLGNVVKSIFRHEGGITQSDNSSCTESCLDEIEFLQELIQSIQIATQEDVHLMSIEAENPQEQEDDKHKRIYGRVNELTLVLQDRVACVERSRRGKLSKDSEILHKKGKNARNTDQDCNRAQYALKYLIDNPKSAQKMEHTVFHSNNWAKYQPLTKEGGPTAPLIWHANSRHESTLGYVSEESEEEESDIEEEGVGSSPSNEDQQQARAPYEGLSPLRTLPRPQDVSFGLGSVVHDYLDRQGYYVWPGVTIPMSELSNSVKTLVEDGWPASFIFMLDEAWEILLNVWDLAAPVLGQECVLEPTFFATLSLPGGPNSVATKLSANLHQPRRNYSSHESTFPDGYERLLQFWLPLTDDGNDGASFCVVPKEFDENFETAGPNTPLEEESSLGRSTINFDVSGVRTLQSTAGTVVLCRGNAIHWTTRPRNSGQAQSSLCCTFRHQQSADLPVGTGLTREQVHAMDRTKRLQLICRSLLLHHPNIEEDALPRFFWDRVPDKLKREMRSIK